jgi:hypothetical protein
MLHVLQVLLVLIEEHHTQGTLEHVELLVEDLLADGSLVELQITISLKLLSLYCVKSMRLLVG